MAIWNTYQIPNTITDALKVLSSTDAPVRVVAGGTDLLLDIQQGRHPAVDTLVDVTRIPELNRLELREKTLFIGAAVPVTRVIHSSLVIEHAQALVEAAGLIGGPQVRNVATLGGNVAHALPAADGTIGLLALDAQAEIASLKGLRRAPLLELFRGPGKSALDPHAELLVGFYLPLKGAGEASGFARVMRPQGVALPILNMAAWLRRDGQRIDDIRIAVGPAGPVPRRASEAENVLRGQLMNSEIRKEALEQLLSQMQFRTSPHRATKEYRIHLSGVLLDEVLDKAWQRAISGSPVVSTLEAI
jgi:xanthine dehydrogenase FAD-binding subunit